MAPTTRRKISAIVAGIGLAAATLGAPAGAIRAQFASASDQDPLALVTIPDPRQASLLQLRGYSGAGTVLFRIEGECHSMPVRLVAGDFGGDGIAIDQGGPIRLRITGPAIVLALYQGQDLVSDELEVGAGMGDTTAGILIEAGLSAETGFVINPGSSLLADLLGVRPTPVPCSSIDLATPGIQ